MNGCSLEPYPFAVCGGYGNGIYFIYGKPLFLLGLIAQTVSKSKPMNEDCCFIWESCRGFTFVAVGAVEEELTPIVFGTLFSK